MVPVNHTLDKPSQEATPRSETPWASLTVPYDGTDGTDRGSQGYAISRRSCTIALVGYQDDR